jgi:protein transport protein SEC23
MRESIANCMVMIQPALIRYSATNTTPEPVELDINELKEDVILLLDTYFNVLVWYGENAYGWKEQNLQDEPDYEYLKEFFEMPMQDASDIMYDRLPISNFYETFKNDGKERYLKSRVNPNKSRQAEDDGHFVSDDAPITLFMDYLVRSVINYNE